MVFFDGALGLVFFALWLFCIIDVITTPQGTARNLPKLVWLLLVVVLVDIGSIAWLVAGRPWAENGARAAGPKRSGRPRPAARPAAISPDDDEQFLAGLQARADEQRRRAREAGTDQPG